MAMQALKVIVFVGSTREGRMADRVLQLVNTALANYEVKHQVEVLDPRELKLDMLEKPHHFYQGEQPPQKLTDINEKIKAADAFLIMSPEYNCTLPPALTNMLDHFSPNSYAHRPAAILTYSMGSYGGCRSAVAIRPFLSELSMVSVPFCMTIPKVMMEIKEDGTTENDHLKKNIVKLLNHMTWYGSALKAQKEKEPLPQ